MISIKLLLRKYLILVIRINPLLLEMAKDKKKIKNF